MAPIQDPATQELRGKAFRSIAKDDANALAEVLGQKPMSDWSTWRNGAGQDLLSLCKERGACRSYSVLIAGLGVNKEVGGCVKSVRVAKTEAQASEQVRAFRAVAQDDMETLGAILAATPPDSWSQWKNKAGKTLLGMSQERGCQGSSTMLKKTMRSGVALTLAPVARRSVHMVAAAPAAPEPASPVERVRSRVPSTVMGGFALNAAAIEEPAMAPALSVTAAEFLKMEPRPSVKMEPRPSMKQKAEEAELEAKKKEAELAALRLEQEEQQRQVDEARKKAEDARKLAEEEEEAERKAEEADAKRNAEEAAAAAKAAEEAPAAAAEAAAAPVVPVPSDGAAKQQAEAEAKQKQDAEALKRKQEEEAKAKEAAKPAIGKQTSAKKEPPPMMQGLLSKESTGGWFSSKKFDPKYVILQDSKFSWWKDKAEASAWKQATGVVDLGATNCEVVPDATSPLRFMLRPKGTTSAWVGTFSGAEKGREFAFDCEKSDHNCAEWVKGLNAHIEFGHSGNVQPKSW